ncbi:type II toxin-antitoxin system RelE/ParE family toxin [Lichenihabitans psoromatis]|uniref:type II toxin-antitoxin system RelE/ParE family toxin n=1 Tax=Lichenihabitans psoromatis TaxID=2528642 RepID=UPI001035567F|nr:type II toxin-antitoxin system RelE/ParE family toxin [Lichenihabitans psoromatis]
MPFEVRQTLEFQAWLADLRDERTQAKIAQRLVRIEAGLLGDAKPVGEGVSELRIDWGPGYRVYFVRRGQAVIVLLCGGDKDSQTRDIKVAKVLAVGLEG